MLIAGGIIRLIILTSRIKTRNVSSVGSEHYFDRVGVTGSSPVRSTIYQSIQSSFAYINDSFVAADKATLFVNDLAIQRGYGIFDFFKIINGRFIFLHDHLDRFFYSAAQMHLPVGKSKEELVTILHELSVKNHNNNAGIRITLTGGYSTNGYSLQHPNLIITQSELPADNKQLTGIKLVTYPHQRQLPHVKTIDYLMAIWLAPYMTQHGADDVLYHQNGIITECPRSNIFIVTNDDRLITPAENILKGVTRKQVIAIAKEKFAVEEKNVSIEDLLQAKEVFITSTTKLVLPVLRVDDQQIGTGKTGEAVPWLKEQLSQLIHADDK